MAPIKDIFLREQIVLRFCKWKCYGIASSCATKDGRAVDTPLTARLSIGLHELPTVHEAM